MGYLLLCVGFNKKLPTPTLQLGVFLLLPSISTVDQPCPSSHPLHQPTTRLCGLCCAGFAGIIIVDSRLADTISGLFFFLFFFCSPSRTCSGCVILGVLVYPVLGTVLRFRLCPINTPARVGFEIPPRIKHEKVSHCSLTFSSLLLLHSHITSIVVVVAGCGNSILHCIAVAP